MKAYTNVSRKTVGEDRVAICPNFGCEFMTRVKPLKMRFFGFGKYPKCKKHHIPLVYVDERIGDFVDAALACLFDKSGLPTHELLESVKSKFSDEVTSFVEGWVYCITVGRGAPIVSRYMDAISNAYLKQLTKKQIKALKKSDDSKPNLVNKAIKDGMEEITIQYTRILKHLRAHSEILVETQRLKSLSKNLRNFLKDWQKYEIKHNEIINSPETKRELALNEIKFYYDQILNIGTCRSLLGLNPESKDIKKARVTAFDRFSAYHDFLKEALTSKFTKSDISKINSESKLKNHRNPDIDKSQCDVNNNNSFFEDIENQIMNSQDLQRKFWVEIINKSNQDRYLRDVYIELKQKNPKISMEWINQYLEGGRYSSYIKGARIPYNRFLKLKELLIKNIPKKILIKLYHTHSEKTSKFDTEIIPYYIYLTIKDTIPYTPLPKNFDTAELVSIMLGDGHLHTIHSDKVVQVSLNPVDEERYFEYVGKLLKKIFPHSNFRIEPSKGKGAHWITTSSRIHFALCELGKGIKKTGLVPGNKVENQVSEPEWVLTNQNFIKRGLKGLFDTDGSISVSRKSQLVLTFSNSSKNLVNDFYFMCKKIGINKIGEVVDAGHDTWRVAIYDSNEVKLFLELVKPEKLKEPLRVLWLGLNVIYRRAPEVFKKSIKDKISSWKCLSGNDKSYFSYSKESTNLLKDWMENSLTKLNIKFVFGCRFSGQISDSMIKNALKISVLSQYELISYSTKGCIEGYRVHWFPEKMRNYILDYITKNLGNENSRIVDLILINILSNSQIMAHLNPFNEKEYNIALKNYIESLILVLREIRHRMEKCIDVKKIGHYSIESHFKNQEIKLAFGRKIIRKIIEYASLNY